MSLSPLRLSQGTNPHEDLHPGVGPLLGLRHRRDCLEKPGGYLARGSRYSGGKSDSVVTAPADHRNTVFRYIFPFLSFFQSIFVISFYNYNHLILLSSLLALSLLSF